jgi:hypothetical protein
MGTALFSVDLEYVVQYCIAPIFLAAHATPGALVAAAQVDQPSRPSIAPTRGLGAAARQIPPDTMRLSQRGVSVVMGCKVLELSSVDQPGRVLYILKEPDCRQFQSWAHCPQVRKEFEANDAQIWSRLAAMRRRENLDG